MSYLVLFPNAVRDHHQRQSARAADALRFIVEAHRAPDNEARRRSWDLRYKALKSLEEAHQQAIRARQLATQR